MLASATRAPAASCGDPSALTPTDSARSAAMIRDTNATSCLEELTRAASAPTSSTPIRTCPRYWVYRRRL
ncbi:hypothetical protein NY08_4734 [Rhodococcus sp. B7740]|nr:hypothetical protein NY08_4734 [Rhodococcus sp. B7740]